MTFATERTRFYDPKTAQPVGQMLTVKGTMRDATLRDAKKSGYVRSVTTVIREAAAPGLEQWKRRQLVMSALTLPKPDGMSLDDFIAKIEADAAEEGKRAAERGSEVHGAIQKYCAGQTHPLYARHLAALDEALRPYGIDLTKGESERTFVTDTYGGTVDWADDRFVVDWKSKVRIDDKTVAYDLPHGVQLAAYDRGKGRRLLNVFVGIEDAKVWVHEWPAEEIPRLRAMWTHLLNFSRAKDGLA